LELQKGLRANELANPGAVRKARRRVARILTIMAEKSKSDNNEGKETK
jgi:ribosomal protein L29